MANEKRLIDANAKELMNKINIHFGGVTRFIIKSILKDAPTVVAVEVIRCENCKYFSRNMFCYAQCRRTEKNDFCSGAERKK